MGSLADSLHEVFSGLGRVEVKRMFGGHGVFHDGLMVGLVASGVLYLKSDEQSAVHFEALDLEPFTYLRAGKVAALTSYRQAPETVFEDREAAALWTRRAFEAALRKANAPRRKAARKSSTDARIDAQRRE